MPTVGEAMMIARDIPASSPLSAPDREVYVIAKSRGMTVWSNDSDLRKQSRRNDVPVSWCFTEIVRLVAAGLRTADEVLSVAVKIEETNLYQKGLATRVAAKLKALA